MSAGLCPITEWFCYSCHSPWIVLCDWPHPCDDFASKKRINRTYLTNARPRITRSGSKSAHLMRRSSLACDIDKILLSWYCMQGVRTPERRRAPWENRGERTRNADPAAPVAEPIALVRIRTETQRETLMPESNLNFQVERAAGDRCRSALERHRSFLLPRSAPRDGGTAVLQPEGEVPAQLCSKCSAD